MSNVVRNLISYVIQELYPIQHINVEYLRNIELQYCEHCSNIAECKFNVEETLQKHLMLNCNVYEKQFFAY